MAKREQSKLLTRAQLASALGVTAGTVTRWQADGMPVARKRPRGQATLFRLADVKRWREQVTTTPMAGLSLERERALLTMAQRRKLDRDDDVARGELITIAEVVRDGQGFVMAWRAKVLGLARRLVQIGAIPKESEARVKEGCRDLLTEISTWRTVADCEAATEE